MKLSRKSVFAFATVAAFAIGGLTLSAQQGFSQMQGRDQGRQGPVSAVLSGTYELDSTQGDDPTSVAEAATSNMSPDQRDSVYETLLDRLSPPDMLSIERRGRTITLSSTTAPRTSFEADGIARRETNTSQSGTYGRPVSTSTRAVLAGERLSVSSQGNRETDFTVTFQPLQGGNRLLVTRQIYIANSRQPVVTRTYYTRVSTEPEWDLYAGDTNNMSYDPRYDARTDTRDPRYDPRANTNTNTNNGATLLVPEGTRISAVLDTAIDTRTARAGDRFSMTVQGPNEYRDAKIEGVIRSSNVSSTDRPADLRVAFDTIRLRTGQTGTLEATLDTVRKPGGEVLRVDGTIQDNKTTNSVETGAIGAAIGGVIGVLAGGTKGAVIGAVIGGAAGAGGAILANQRDRYLDLPIGTEVTIVTGYRTTGGR